MIISIYFPFRSCGQLYLFESGRFDNFSDLLELNAKYVLVSSALLINVEVINHRL